MAVLNSASVSFPSPFFFSLHFKRWHIMGPVWSHSWCELWGWSLESLFSDFSVIHCLILVAVRHFGIYHFFSPLKKKVLSPDIFLAAKITPDGMFCIGKKTTIFHTFSMNYFAAFNFDEVINLIKDPFCRETKHWTNALVYSI